MPADTLICPYCKTRHDVDLKSVHHYTVVEPESQRFCPRCNKSMQTIDLKVSGPFLVERCTQCMGLFFDLNELETLLEKSIANVYEIDHNRLQELRDLKRHQDFPVTYIKCPICRKLMNRINYGAQSGVIIDKCRDHGIWLDGGELRQILEWTKAGGQINHEKNQIEMEKINLQQEKEKLRFQQLGSMSGHVDPTGFANRDRWDRYAAGNEWDIFDVLTRFVGKIFR